MTRSTYIYGLRDPRDSLYYYIGKSDRPNIRLAEHLKDGAMSKKVAWISNLKKNNLVPDLVILEECESSKWGEREKYWIKNGIDKGWPLTNISSGGGGNLFSSFLATVYMAFDNGLLEHKKKPLFDALTESELFELAMQMGMSIALASKVIWSDVDIFKKHWKMCIPWEIGKEVFYNYLDTRIVYKELDIQERIAIRMRAATLAIDGAVGWYIR